MPTFDYRAYNHIVVLIAAGMVDSARFQEAVEFNLEPSGNFERFVAGPAELTLPQELG